MAEAKKVKAVADFRAMDEKALTQKVADLRKELVEQQRAHKAGELPSSAVLGKIRKDIATALTVLKEKALAGEQKEQEK